MRSGFGIGKVFGIKIRIDWSWLLILLLVTWNLSTLFGQAHPSWGSVQVWGMAIVAAFLFFASVLAHELAHSLVARARGIPVRGITLFLFGGVSDIQREPSSPSGEFLMAIVGPLTSIVLGGLLVALAGVGAGPFRATLTNPTRTAAQLGMLSTLLLWLGSINVILGIFNMIPVFPLDGGRVLRSILWAIVDNLQVATRWASVVGQAIAWLMIIGGISMAFGVQIPFFGTGLVSGLWLAFIGWFLNSASIQSYQQVVVNDILEGVPVARMMRSDPPSCSADCSVSRLVHDHIIGTDDHAFPVLDNGRLLGIVTLEDVRKVSRDAWDRANVREIMTPADQLTVVTAAEDAAEALNKLTQREVGQVPVLRNGQLVRLLRRQDLVRWLQLHAQLVRG